MAPQIITFARIFTFCRHFSFRLRTLPASREVQGVTDGGQVLHSVGDERAEQLRMRLAGSDSP